MKNTLFYFCLLFSFLGFPQNIRLIDSLKKVSRTKPISDLNQILIYPKIATSYMRNHYDSSKLYVESSLMVAEKINNDSLGANALRSISGLKTRKSNFDETLKFYQQALPIFEKMENKTGMGRVYYNLGNLHRQLQENALKDLAECYRFKKDFPKAIEYGKAAIEISLNLKDPNRAFNSYQVLHRVQSDAVLYKDALHSLERYKALEDSTLKNEKMKRITDLESKYKTEKKDIEIHGLNLKNDLQKRQLGFLLVGLLALMGFIAALFFQNKKIKDSRNVIAKQSDELKFMMKELHHRVKNNLAIVSSLLKIQSGKIEDEKAVKAIRKGQQRVEAMSLIHQRLYLTDRVTNINVKQYINDLAESLMTAYNFEHDNFDLELNIPQEELDVDIAIPIGLIINELLTNSFKYAYGNIERPLLKISFKTDKGITLEVQDNGPGINLQSWEKDENSFGKKLITGLCKQLKGNFSIENNHGTLFKLHIATDRVRKARR